MREPTEMKLERLAEILDAYGGDPLRWPEAERLAAQGLVARDPRAAAMAAEAEALDALLDASPGLAPSVALNAAVLARRPRPSLWRELFPSGGVLKPALGFAMALAVGVGIQNAAADGLGLNAADEIAAGETVNDDATLTPLSGGAAMSEEDVL